MTVAGRFLKRQAALLLVVFLSLLTFLAQYALRGLDDNRLTSWRWCFQDGTAATVFSWIAVGALLAYCLAVAAVRLRHRAVALFLLAFGMTCLFWREPEVILDASRYFTQAKHLEVYGIRYFLEEWGRGIEAWTDMPLVPFLYGLIFRAFGESRIVIQAFTSLLFALTCVLTYRVGCELWDEDTGFYGGAFLLGMPYLYSQTPLMLVDVASAFFLLFAVLTFLRALKRGGLSVLCAGAAIFLAFYSKYSTWPMLSVCAIAAFVFVLVEAGRERKKVILRTLLAAAISASLIGAVFLYKFGVFSDQIRLLIGYQKPGLGRWGESFTSTFLFQMHPFITLLALFSAVAALRKKDPRYVIVAWLVVLLVALQIRRSRYSIPVFPMLALSASYGLCRLRDARVRRCIVACVVTSSLAVAFFAYLPFLRGLSAVNIQRAGAFLNGLKGRDVEVFSLASADPVVDPSVNVPLLDIFTHKRILYDYRGGLPQKERERIAGSSLRFTVEYRNPKYYLPPPQQGKDPAVAVLSDTAMDVLPGYVSKRLEGYRQVKVFDGDEGIFRYRTCVRVFERVVSEAEGRAR
ncbi:MAG: glycosyltransferase family 39 protein [Nitrospiraceae bacterium]|nr:glycosyltransferase family 39 protein [Nitrospiraceae bacterium]